MGGYMKTALLVIDMQRILVGKNHAKMFKYNNAELLERVNRHISEYPCTSVFYIRKVMKKNLINRLSPVSAFDGDPNTELADELNIVSNNNYKKFAGDALTNPELLTALRATGIEAIDIVGVDGCGCVPMTAEGAARNGFSVRILSDAVATMFPARTAKQRARISKLGVKYVD